MVGSTDRMFAGELRVELKGNVVGFLYTAVDRVDQRRDLGPIN